MARETLFHSSQQFVKQGRSGADAAVEVLQVKAFVGGMGAVVGASPSHHQDGFQPELLLEDVDDGYGPAFSNEDRPAAEGFLDGWRGFLMAMILGQYGFHKYAALVTLEAEQKAKAL